MTPGDLEGWKSKGQEPEQWEAMLARAGVSGPGGEAASNGHTLLRSVASGSLVGNVPKH